MGFAASRPVSKRRGFGSLAVHGALQFALSHSSRKSLTTHSSRPLRCSGGLIQALGGRAFSFVSSPHGRVRVPHGWCCRPACVAVFRRSSVCRTLRALSFLASSCRESRAVRGDVHVIASYSLSSRTPSHSRHCRPSKAALSCSHTSAWRAAVLTSHSSGRLRRRLIQALDATGKCLE